MTSQTTEHQPGSTTFEGGAAWNDMHDKKDAMIVTEKIANDFFTRSPKYRTKESLIQICRVHYAHMVTNEK